MHVIMSYIGSILSVAVMVASCAACQLLVKKGCYWTILPLTTLFFIGLYFLILDLGFHSIQ